MSSEEHYLNDLLNSLSESVHAKSEESVSADALIENEDAGIFGIAEDSLTLGNEIAEESVVPEELQISEDFAMEQLTAEDPAVEEPILLDEINLDSIEIPEIPEIPDMELHDLDIKIEGDLDSLEIPQLVGNETDGIQTENPEVGETMNLADTDLSKLWGMDKAPENIGLSEVTEELHLEDAVLPEMDGELHSEDAVLPEMGGELHLEDAVLPEMDGELQLEDIEMTAGLQLDNIDLTEFAETEDELKLEDIAITEDDLSEIEMLNLGDVEFPSFDAAIPEQMETSELLPDDLAMPELSETPEEPQPEYIEQPELQLEDIVLPELEQPEPEPELQLEDIVLPELEQPELESELQLEDIILPELEQPESELQLEDIVLPELEQPEPEPELQLEDITLPELEQTEPEPELQLEDIVLPELEQPVDITQPEVTEEIQEIPKTDENVTLEDIGMPELDDDLKLEDFEMPEIPDDDSLLQSDLNIDGLEEAIQSETETAMAGELNIDEFDFGDSSSDLGVSMELPDDLSLSDDSSGDLSAGMDDSLEDVLNMLDDDAELAEINDMLKKSDNNEPIQDDMMDILNQMADDEAASVNAGVKHVDDEDDGGVPLPVIPESILNPDGAGSSQESSGDNDMKKKSKKNVKKKKKGDTEENEAEVTKEPGKIGKFFNLLTEELVPEPTEEELAAEKEAKQAKKKEELTKKEEEKLAKEEEKKAKAEEKAAANKAKQEAAAQKKKEKKAAKEAKLAAKRAAEGPKKRIPPKKIAAAAAFGASVGGAVILAANILSTQGYLQKARNAYYDKDYKTVYQAMFGMELDESKDEGLIKARSEVIYKIQRRYDSYQINLKMGREMEALDALLQGIATYDYINADAEKYGVADEVDAVKETILNTLADKYSVDEAKARELINTEDALTYSIALSDIIAAN